MDPLITQPLPEKNGYTFTIASRIAEALHAAEEAFGPRDTNYFFAGFEFSPDGPQLWYPWNRKQVVMQLSLSALQDFPQAIYQLAHETVHLLCPTGGRNATVLEEGLAQHFSESFSLSACGRVFNPSLQSYAHARDAVRQLLAADADAIKKLRALEPCLSRISSALIQAQYPGLDSTLAASLATRFKRE